MEFVYSALGQIAQIKQEHFGAVSGATPFVEYIYETQDAANGNYSRPVSMEYPIAETLLQAVYNTAGQGSRLRLIISLAGCVR